MPNPLAAMDARRGSACYPQSTFYLLSDGPSTRDRRITKPDFRLCSAYLPRSQAPFYLYARRPIANRAEGTFGLLRYSFGGDRPSQTAQLTLSSPRVHGVFPSNYGYVASSRRLQFHRVAGGDSGPVVTPFMQVGTYPTRNFATLGPSELRPPFTGTSIQCLNISY